MNSPDQDEQLPLPVSKVLAADTQAPSAETDQRILQFAAQHAPTSESSGWKAWMPATAACCLVGVLTLSLLPEQQTETVRSVEADMQVTKSREAIREVAMQSNRELADTAPADEFLLEESEAKKTASTINFTAAAAPVMPAEPATTNDVLSLNAVFFERLLDLSERHRAARDLSADLTQSGTHGLTKQTAKQLQQSRPDADSPPLMRAKMSGNKDHNAAAYATLREECNCSLPKSLQQALEMLAVQKIRLDNSEPQTMDNE